MPIASLHKMQPSETSLIGSQPARLTVLILDDERVSRSIIARLVTKHTRSVVHEASTVEEALELLESGLMPDLIVSDVVMPGMNGEEFLTRLRTDHRWRELRVLICSSANNRQTVERLARLGICGYILKPIAFNRLVEELRRVEKSGPVSAVLEPRPAVLQRLGLSDADYDELLELFQVECDRQLADLQAAAFGDQVKDVQRVLHSLHGAACNLGARPLAQATDFALAELKNPGVPNLGRVIEPVLAEAWRLGSTLKQSAEPAPAEA